MIRRDASLRIRPRYVERGGDIVYRQPFLATKARMYNFVIEADVGNLKVLLDQSFNRPSAGAVDYAPVGPYVSLNFVKVQRLGSGVPDNGLGAIEEAEVALWAPCRPLHAPGSMAWSVPYMFVDSGTALASGREVFGYPKQLGAITIGGDDPAMPEWLNLKTLACREFAPAALAREEDVITIRRAGAPPPLPATQRSEEVLPSLEAIAASPDAQEDRERLVRDVTGLASRVAGSARPEDMGGEHLLELFRNPLDFARTALALLGDVLERKLRMVFLKQFRSSESPEAACYQAVVEVAHQLTRFRSFGFLPPDYEITIPHLDSNPIVRDLGLPSTVLQPRLAFWLEFDFKVESGRVLWQAI